MGTGIESDHLAETVPSQRDPEHDHMIDFTHMSPDELASYLLAELRHPSLHQFSSERLTEFISTRLLVDTGDGSSLGTNIRKFINSSEIFSNPDLYDEKVKRDEVFAYLARALQATRGDVNRSTQRKAIMNLLNFRGSFSVHSTPEDGEWKELVVRLLA